MSEFDNWERSHKVLERRIRCSQFLDSPTGLHGHVLGWPEDTAKHERSRRPEVLVVNTSVGSNADMLLGEKREPRVLLAHEVSCRNRVWIGLTCALPRGIFAHDTIFVFHSFSVPG